MNKSRSGSNVGGSSDNLSIEGQLASLAIQTACDDVHQATDLVEPSSKEQVWNVIGQHVSKRFAELMYEGVVESHDNAAEMFKVVYTNGHSEEMRWEDLMKYLLPHEQPLHPYPNELPTQNDETGEGLAQIAPVPSTRKHRRTKKMSSGTQGKEGADNIGTSTHRHRRTKKMSSGTQGKEGADNVCLPRQAETRGLWRSTGNDETSKMRKLQRSNRNDETLEMMKLQRSASDDETSGMKKLWLSTRKNETSSSDETPGMMKLQHSTRKNETSSSDETSGVMKLRRSTRKNETSGMMQLRRSTRKRKQVVYSYCEEMTDENEDDEPNYPLPPIIQVPWADAGDENLEGVATRGRCAPQDRRKSGRAKRHWVSLRISASCYPGDGHNIASDESEGLGD